MPEKFFVPKRLVKLRREFSLTGYKSLKDVNLDGGYVTPLQIVAHSKTGPCLVAYNWIDDKTAIKNRDFLAEYGYLPKMTFNEVLERAFKKINICRKDTYMTQAFHLLPNERSGTIPVRDVRKSFKCITLHEIKGRKVVALGKKAGLVCEPFKDQYVAYVKTKHPSARGETYEKRASDIAEAIKSVL